VRFARLIAAPLTVGAVGVAVPPAAGGELPDPAVSLPACPAGREAGTGAPARRSWPTRAPAAPAPPGWSRSTPLTCRCHVPATTILEQPRWTDGLVCWAGSRSATRAVPTVTPFTTTDYCPDWHRLYHTWSAGTCPAGATVQE
jgi:hypothetical protein